MYKYHNRKPPPEIFISYSHSDSSYCYLIAQALKDAGFTVWIDKDSIRPGDSWVRSIFLGMEKADYVLILLSNNSINSTWVQKEIETAIATSLSDKKSLTIIPILLEGLKIPPALRTLQYLDLRKNFSSGIKLLIDRINLDCIDDDNQKSIQVQREGTNFPLKKESSFIGTTVDTIGSTLMALLHQLLPKSRNKTMMREQLIELHRQMLRLQSIIDHLAILEPELAEDLWSSAGEIMPNPIPGPNRILKEIDSRLHHVNTSKQMANLPTKSVEQLSLLKKYITVMRDLTNCLQSTLTELIQLSIPDLSDSFSRIWLTKVNLYRTLKNMHQKNKESKVAEYIMDNEDILKYIEAARTLNARALLQVIDADARGVAHDLNTGMTVFGELCLNAKSLNHAIVSARRQLGQFIVKYWPQNYDIS